MGFSSKHYRSLLDRAGRAGVLLSEDHYDAATDTLVVRTSQDVGPILDKNAELANAGLSGQDGYFKTRWMRRVASIPNIIVHKWLQEGINIYDENDWPKVKARLNSSEWSRLRTASGRL